MRSIFNLLERITKRSTTLTATKGGVVVNGKNTGVIITNDIEDIKSAVTEVITNQSEARSHGVAAELQGEIGRQIDHYRDKMNAGSVKEALDLYSELLTHQAKNLTPHSIFRIKANIAICMHLMGDAAEASRILLEACTYAPDDDKAVAFKAFAYVIAGDAAKAVTYGLSALDKNPLNDTLAGFIIQAARIDSQYREEFNDPFDKFSDDLKKTKNVRLAHIHFLAAKEVQGWRDLANEYLAEEPEDLLAKSLVAQGILQNYVNERQSPNGFKFTSKDINELKVACKHFEDYWNDFRDSDRRANGWDFQVVHSLILCYKLSGNFDDLRALCTYAMAELADDQGLVETIVKCLLDLNEPEVCSKAIDRLENLDEARKLKFLLMVAQKDWVALSKFQDYSLARFEGNFLIQAKVVVFISRAHKGDARGKLHLEQLLQQEQLDSRARLLLFDFSSACGIRSIAEVAHSYGAAIINERSDFIEFFHYMRLVRSLMIWKEIVLRLPTFPDALDNYELKHMLALGYLNEQPMRAEAVEFFEELSEDPKGFELFLGIFYFKRRRFESAPELIASYYESGGRDLYGFLALIDMAKMQNDTEMLKKIFCDYNPSLYDGSPEQWMHVARGLIEIGESKQGLDLAYRTYIDHTNLAKVALGYFHVFLTANKDALLDDAIVVGAGCHIKLVSSESIVIERDVSETIDDDLALSPENVDTYVHKTIGQRVGYQYQQEKLQGVVVWTLEEVKHKYLDAFHKICTTYENQFPEEGGLWSLKVEDGNVQSLLDFIKKQAERDENFISMITSNHIPLSIASGMWRKNIFQVSDLLRLSNKRIDTCAGTHEERLEALDIITRHKGGTIILDAYTSWVAAELDLLEVLNDYFKSLVVSQASVDSMRLLVGDIGDFKGPGCNIGWVNGVFVKTEYTESDVQGQAENFLRNILSIESRCNVVHFDFPSDLDELTETLLDITPEAVAPYFLAKNNNALFVSDDGYSRGFAKNAYGLMDSTWLQAIVNELARERIITPDHYVDVILGLCRFKHTSVSISSYVIDSVFDRDSTSDLHEFKLICEYIGGPNAETKSHFDLVMKFILRHWLFEYNPSYNLAIENMLLKSHGDAFPSAKVKSATTILLERVRLMPDGITLLLEIGNYPILRLEQFIIEWWKGHFYK